LEGVSGVYTQQSLTERLIANVNVQRVSKVEQEPTRVVLADDHFQKRWLKEVVSNDRHTAISAENLAKKWNIGLGTASQTLRVTTQKGVRHAVHPLHKRYRSNHLNMHRRKLNARFYTDHLVSKVKSLEGMNGAWIFTTGKFTQCYPVESKSEAGDALRRFADDIGIPTRLTCDLAGELTGKNTEFMKNIKKMQIDLTYSEKGRSNENHHAEREIGILKQRWQQKMVRKNVPRR